MNDNEIKEKLKAAKGKIKEDKKIEKSKKDKASYLVSIIGALVIALSTIVIPTSINYKSFSFILYITVTSFVFSRLYYLYFFIKLKKYVYFEKYLWVFYILVSVLVVVFNLERNIGFAIWFAPIVNIISAFLNEFPYIGLGRTIEEKNKLDDEPKKATELEAKKTMTISTIIAIVGGLFSAGVGFVLDKDHGIWGISIYSAIILSIATFIIKIIISKVSKKSEDLVNKAFSTHMGGYKGSNSSIYGSSTYYDLRYIYNYGALAYRICSPIVCLIALIIESKFDLGLTIVVTSIYIIMNLLIVRYDEGEEFIGNDGVVARVYDKDGNERGTIRNH